jgi:hypothetical protein
MKAIKASFSQLAITRQKGDERFRETRIRKRKLEVKNILGRNWKAAK